MVYIVYLLRETNVNLIIINRIKQFFLKKFTYIYYSIFIFIMKIKGKIYALSLFSENLIEEKNYSLKHVIWRKYVSLHIQPALVATSIKQ